MPTLYASGDLPFISSRMQAVKSVFFIRLYLPCEFEQLLCQLSTVDAKAGFVSVVLSKVIDFAVPNDLPVYYNKNTVLPDSRFRA
jgi:hypothetical protein